MIVLGCKNVCKNYGIDVILDNITFNLNKGERVGIVGTNGAGKSTLLNILAGEYSYDSGDIFIPRGTQIELLKQNASYDDEATVWEVALQSISHILDIERKIEENNFKLESLEGGNENEQIEKIIDENEILMNKFTELRGYSIRNEAKTVLRAMGFGKDELDKKTKVLSGGEKTRLALGCILMKKPDILLLDEPTNHLDIGAIQWLEEYLKDYSGTFMVISHDRYFLNKITDKTIEIENKKAEIYSGGYDFYAAEKKKRFEEKLKKYESYKRELDRQEEIIRRFKQHGTEKLAKRAASREKRLEKMNKVDKVAENNKSMALKLKQNFRSGNDVIYVSELCKSFGYGESRQDLFQNLDLDIKRGEKICIVGANGIGKSTFLKIIKGDRSSSSGFFKLGQNVEIGYYDQTQENLNDDMTVIEEIHSTYRLYTNGEIRGFLGMFMFKDDMINLPVRALSGGEKARLSLLKLMLQGANLLLLDEPTNHLDISSKEVFEDAILDFEGTAVIVSHDRYLLSKVPDKIIELTKHGAKIYLGKYDYYMEKKSQEDLPDYDHINKKDEKAKKEIFNQKDNLTGDGYNLGDKIEKKTAISSKEERLLKKEEEMLKKRLERKKKKLEDDISKLEKELERISEKISSEEIAKDHKELETLSNEYSKVEKELEEKYEEWMEIYE